MTEHVHEWKFVVPYYRGAEKVFIVCRDNECKMVMTKKQAEDRLNATERLSADVAHQVSIHYKKRWRGIGGGSNFFKRVWEETQAYADILDAS